MMFFLRKARLGREGGGGGGGGYLTRTRNTCNASVQRLG